MKSIIKSIMFPCLLSCISILSIIYIYEDSGAFPRTAAVIFVANFLIFIALEKMRIYGKNALNTVIIIAAAILTLFAMRELIESQGYGAFREFANWFYRTGGEENAEYNAMFIAALAVMFTPFLASVVFYFSTVKYNSVFLMLTCMVSFSLYAKTFTEIPFIFPSLIIALFLFISIEKRWYKSGASNTLSYGAFVACGGIFVALSAYVAGLFPPVENTPYREQFDEFITGQSIRFLEGTEFALDNSESSGSSNSDMGDEVLFIVSTKEEPDYLRRQVYESWDTDVWNHYREELLDEMSANWSVNDWMYFSDTDSILAAWEIHRDTYLTVDFSSGASQYDISPANEWWNFFSSLNEVPAELSFWEEAPDPYIRETSITVDTDIPHNFKPTPQYPISVDYGYDPDFDIKLSIKGELYSTYDIGRWSTYTVAHYDNGVDEDFLSKLTPEVVQALNDAGKTSYMEEIFGEHYTDYYNSCKELDDYPNRSEVQALAASITEGFESDYEKAKAIESYFYSGEFTYDLNFTPKSKRVDYFLFDSKTGTCSDFATAMTILAREAGLAARYVEGYRVYEKYEPGDGGYTLVNDQGEDYYFVKVKHGHAFPEVFIDGWGWVIFEPTIPDYGSSGGSYSTILALLLIAGGIAVSVTLFMMFALPRIRESGFRHRILKSPRDTQVRMVYEKIYVVFMKRLRLSERTLSSYDLNALALSEYNIPLSALTENYDRVVYGGINAGEGDFYGIYIRFMTAVKKLKKLNKLNTKGR